MKENESKEALRQKLKVISRTVWMSTESEFNRIHGIRPKIKKNAKTSQQIIVKFKGLWKFIVPGNADITIHSDLIKRRYLLLKDAYGKTKDREKLFTNEEWWLKIFQFPWKSGERLLLEIQ